MTPALARCFEEQALAADALRAGHADRAGLERACGDWIAEEVLIRQEAKKNRRRSPRG